MPALWSPTDLAVRFAPYIEELHDVFSMHGVCYGSPDDICQLTERLQKPSSLNEELAALVRSMVLREGGSLPRTDLLEIVAIAIAGPRMNPAGEELQPSVRQLLTFLHSALRRPWNEPPGEERLHPDEDPRAEAARELREAAAKIEAEVQNRGREEPSEVEAKNGAAAHAARANVIPFGRARAVFSRLARTEAGQLSDEYEAEEDETIAPLTPEQTTHAAQDQAAAQTAQDQIPQPVVAGAANAAKVFTPASVPQDQPVAEHPIAETAVEEKATDPMPAEVSAASEPALAVAESKPSTMELLLLAETPVLMTNLAATDASETVSMPAASQQPTDSSSVAGQQAIPSPPVPAKRPASSLAPVSEFDEEPPLPAAPRINRTVFIYGIAAVVLLAAGLGFALRTGSAAQGTRNSLSLASASASKPVEAPGAARAVAIPVAGAIAADAGPKPNPTTDLSVSQPSHVSHFDDDYIAPPYSNSPLQEDSAAAVVPAQPANPATSSLGNNVPTAEQAAAESASEVRVVATRPRDPDAIIAGDRGGRTSTIALAEPPPHPHIAAGLMAENLVSAPKPDYPALAKIAHVDGPVVLHAEINRKGEVSDTDVISGHFLLRRAAEAAVKHWRYRPYQVNGKPVPVSTTITVRFRH